MTEDAYARKEGFPTKIVMSILAGVVIILWFIYGYGYFTSPLPAQDAEPPTIWLVYQGDLYTGMRGSYCWTTKCVDTAFPNPPGLIDIAKGSSIGFMTNSLVRPSGISAQVFTIDDLGNPTQVGELVSEGSDKYRVNLEKGVYTVNFFASWEKLGDVSYAFKIRVD